MCEVDPKNVQMINLDFRAMIIIPEILDLIHSGEDPEELNVLITEELQNGRLAMLAAEGYLAQEAVDWKGMIEHFTFHILDTVTMLWLDVCVP